MTTIVAPLRDVARAGLPALNNMFSPSKNPCMVKTTPCKGARRFRYDPYKASVIEPSPMRNATPMMFTAPAPAGAMPVSAFPVPMAPIMRHPHPLGAPMPMHTTSVHVPVPVPMRPSPCMTPVPSMAGSTPMVSAATSRMPSPAPAPTDYGFDEPVVPMMNREMSISGESFGPASSINSSTQSLKSAAMRHYAIVRFKHDTYPYEAPFRVSEGEYVVVEGDRGVNMGVVKSVTTVKPARPVASKILRKASAKDRETLATLRDKETAAVALLTKAVKDHGLNMSVVDTEYQFDQNKLSVFFKANKKVDFRQLLRNLFKEFRCRVWMVNWNEVELDVARN